ncbi:aspartate/tyrosine/aromatic aminotransferase [Sphingomonas sp. RP10(2022)]|uniref:Aspartate/tyrosine/aromatic aminotransferase n=1 Tax=Sphingomonas liriopis TaxID=2949094 RepID=A0A9X2HP71_9SPHN|nr:amino acid aminotransferase [Sphingomonas liriopis]MCP3733817.1 aspartate/tyrosine/aromatic aminotransferase [Sphingomonas liriopis]
MSGDLMPFAALRPQKPDALLALIAMHRADSRLDKIDVGVGVYRDEAGLTPVMQAVKAAEGRLHAEQQSKSYLGAEGDVRFAELLMKLVFGEGQSDARRFGLQTPGGTGALRLGAQLLARAAPSSRVWLSEPTWPNHAPIFAEAGLATRLHPYFDVESRGIAFDAMLEALQQSRAGDVLLLHGCCHNPTGTQFTLEQWEALAALCNERDIVPFVDLAYQGLGNGITADGEGAHRLLDAVPTALVAYSCDKNFALYRDRVGALFVQTPTSDLGEVTRANALALARSLWSMPPDHGAAVVRTILDDGELRLSWGDELDRMRDRLNKMRVLLATAHPALTSVASQRGLFSLLPIAPSAVPAIRQTHGIYMPADGRINIAGLNEINLPRFVEGLLPHLEKGVGIPQAFAATAKSAFK